MLTKEYYALQTAMEKRVVEMETQMAEKTAKLDTYERLEKEMDDVILQAAEGNGMVSRLLTGWLAGWVTARLVDQLVPGWLSSW